MTKDAILKLALDALEKTNRFVLYGTHSEPIGQIAEQGITAITAIKEALAQPEREDETIKSDGSVSLIRENEDGSSDFQFNFPPEALAALTRLGILTAINAGIEEAECLNPDTPPAEETTSKDAALGQALEFVKFLGRDVGMNDYAVDRALDRIEAVLEDALEQTGSKWVGLTEEEYQQIQRNYFQADQWYGIEAKLKEKNT